MKKWLPGRCHTYAGDESTGQKALGKFFSHTISFELKYARNRGYLLPWSVYYQQYIYIQKWNLKTGWLTLDLPMRTQPWSSSMLKWNHWAALRNVWLDWHLLRWEIFNVTQLNRLFKIYSIWLTMFILFLVYWQKCYFLGMAPNKMCPVCWYSKFRWVPRKY